MCVQRNNTLPTGDHVFPLPRANLQVVLGYVNLDAQHVGSKAIRKTYKGRCVHLKNKTQPLCPYSIQIFIIIPGIWPREILGYCNLVFPSKAKDHENNKIIMFKNLALSQIFVTPEVRSEHTSDL